MNSTLKFGIFIIILVVVVLIAIFTHDYTGTRDSTIESTGESKIDFNKKIYDPLEDCTSSQTGKLIKCNDVVDIVSADVTQSDGLVTASITLVEFVPSVQELEIGELFSDTYQYTVWFDLEGKGEFDAFIFGDITKELGFSGGSFNILSCTSDSQVVFKRERDTVVLSAPMTEKIYSVKVETLHQQAFSTTNEASLEDDIVDEAE